MAAYEAAGETDEWYTPKYIFDALGETFDMDVAAPPCGPRHVPTKEWYSSGALENQWVGFVWMNPPFGHQRHKREWLESFSTITTGLRLCQIGQARRGFRSTRRRLMRSVGFLPRSNLSGQTAHAGSGQEQALRCLHLDCVRKLRWCAADWDLSHARACELLEGAVVMDWNWGAGAEGEMKAANEAELDNRTWERILEETAKQLVARIGKDQRLRYKVYPSPGAMLPADSLGGQLTALSDLFKALGKDDGLKLKTMVADIQMDDEGAIEFTLAIMPAEFEEAA